jgi:hypothetical protein
MREILASTAKASHALMVLSSSVFIISAAPLMSRSISSSVKTFPPTDFAAYGLAAPCIGGSSSATDPASVSFIGARPGLLGGDPGESLLGSVGIFLRRYSFLT